MLKLVSTVAVSLALAAAFGVGASRPADVHSDTEAADVYTCPMHPEVTDTKPGRCPKCRMKLVLK